MKLNNGFYTALGTPIDENGALVANSLVRHLEQQIEAGAAGLLLMGSMGIEAYLTNSTYAEAVKVACETVKGRIPLFVGAMDNSIAKVKEKLSVIGDAPIDGVVLTVPFYGTVNDDNAVNWFVKLADHSKAPIYLYDLPSVTKYKIKIDIMDKLVDHPNIKGMKTADWELIHAIGRKFPNADFECLYSGLDSFDYANMMGLGKNLDGMFSCTPKNTRKMVECFEKCDYAGGRKYLDNILLLRDTMIKYGLMQCFTHCMNLLGCDGMFHQDYCVDITDEAREVMKRLMTEIGEL